MKITRIKLRNWRNFRDAEVSDLADVVYVVGRNASGKSNFLDALTFVGDIAKTRGGGLQQAVHKRGGMRKLRSLHARQNTCVEIQIDVSDDQDTLIWSYALSFQAEKGNSNKPYVLAESVTLHSGKKGAKSILNRGRKKGEAIAPELYQTYMEQSSRAKKFQDLADYFSQIRYFHLIPQLVKFRDEIAGKIMDGDPFGQAFIDRIHEANSRDRKRRLKKVEALLKNAIPNLIHVDLVMDKITGKPHLEFKFSHGKNETKHLEDQLSDGTLRLISVLWTCYEFSGHPILIEEPELSFSNGILENLHFFFKKSLEKSKNGGQLFLSTHSRSLLSNPGINTRGFVIIEPLKEGSLARKANQDELNAIKLGFPASDAILGSIEEASSKILGV